ncbi:hypothetical protein [Pseudomonas phage LUZ7]|uniref:Uncharacterized protein n=1 Tax=Pseudomonas phage LUZ7 TaxID=655097 RepID=C8ZKA9_9CAUD|nr:hypothetical protein PP-LUZ7_gp010 [Pseudomonas phage LUZ7]CAZ66151.1 hypothetical protein [Pseudomonas phage LUZ7]
MSFVKLVGMMAAVFAAYLGVTVGVAMIVIHMGGCV